MNFFKRNTEYESVKKVTYRPTYNDKNNLSFSIKGDKQFAQLSDALLDVEFSIKDEFTLDNLALDKLFDSIEIILGKDTITRRSITNEYIWNSFFYNKSNFDVSKKNPLRIQGWFDNANADSGGLKKAKDIVSYRTFLHDEKNNIKKFRLIGPLCTPICHQYQPLPSNIPITINLKRSSPKLPLMYVGDPTDQSDLTPSETYQDNIQLDSATLTVPFVFSNELEKTHNYFMSPLTYPIYDYVSKVQSISAGVTEVHFNLTSGGELPEKFFGGFLDPDNYHGSFVHSATNFKRHSVRKFEVLLDDQLLPGLPITCGEELCSRSYVNWLQMVNQWQNPLSTVTLSLDEFENSNFMHCYDLADITEETGWLSLRFAFDKEITKLVFVAFLVYPKTLTIDKDRNANIN